MGEHTPGPWDCTGCLFPDDGLGGVYYRLQAEGMDARAANARLIASAPDLLEALGKAFETLTYIREASDCEQSRAAAKEVAQEIDAAIARARGGAA